MKRILLVTRPDYDDATAYLSYYAKQAMEFAEEKSVKILDLRRPRLTKQSFSDLVAKQDPLLIFFNAHGNEKSIYGDKIKGKEEVLVKEGENHELLNGRVTYARACWAAASLGKACTTQSGCFIGYNTPFSFWIDERWSAKPSNDSIAKLFLEPSNLIVTSLIKGNTAQQSVDKSLELSKKNVLNLLKTKEEPGAMASVILLWNNMEGQTLLGDKDARFE